MKRYLPHLIRGAEYRTTQFMKEQVIDKNHPMYGGLRGEIIEAKPTIYAMANLASVYLNKDSSFYHSKELGQRMTLAASFIRRVQREDGSFDYPSCNFKSAADTSFCFKRLIATYRLFVKYEETECTKGLKQAYLIIMKDALRAICVGGFHTPNHRWGICAALLQGSNLFAEDSTFANKLKERAKQYLAEGIDGDEDGDYAERSTGNYNAVVNNAMIAMYEETKDESFLGYIERNLTMMLTYIDPDHTVFTQNSTRQDQGRQEYADKYFYQYLFMCSRKESPAFDGAAHQIIKDNMERGDIAPECLHIIMDHEAMHQHNFTHLGFQETYKKFYPHSGVLRAKTKNYTYTVLRGKSAFLYVKSEETMVHMKIGESYCDIRNFIPQTVEVVDNKTILTSTAYGWYYLPFETKPETSDWWEMDHSKREILYSSQVTITVTIEELVEGLDITVKAEGLDKLPLRCELGIPAEAIVQNEHFYLKASAGNHMILRSGNVGIQTADSNLSFGPGFGEHEFPGHYQGEEKNTTGYTIYCNAYTPCEKTLHLRVNNE